MLTALSQEVASVMTIQRVGVVGFGQMGSGIAQICAQAGLDTVVREVEQSLVDKGFQRTRKRHAAAFAGRRRSPTSRTATW